MTFNAKYRLRIIILWVSMLSLGIGLILYNLNKNISFFYTPAEVIDYANKGEIKTGEQVRIGGLVKPGSLESQAGSKFNFKIMDESEELEVTYQGGLPNLFKENQTVVITGRLTEGAVIATEILAKHDENYKPPKLRD